MELGQGEDEAPQVPAMKGSRLGAAPLRDRPRYVYNASSRRCISCIRPTSRSGKGGRQRQMAMVQPSVIVSHPRPIWTPIISFHVWGCTFLSTDWVRCGYGFSIEAMDFELHFGRGAVFAGRYIIGLYHALFAENVSKPFFDYSTHTQMIWFPLISPTEHPPGWNQNWQG